MERKSGASAGLVRYCDGSVQTAADVGNDCQANAHSAEAPLIGGVELGERFEDGAALVGGHSVARVAHDTGEEAIGVAGLDANPAGGGEFHRVSHEVENGLTEQTFVALQAAGNGWVDVNGKL